MRTVEVDRENKSIRITEITPIMLFPDIPRELIITEGQSAKPGFFDNIRCRIKQIMITKAKKKYDRRVANRQKLYEKRRKLGRVK